jgi:hypothetical protein
MTSFRLFLPSTQGPMNATPYQGPFRAGVVFQVTAWNTWLEGFWWWVPEAGDVGPQQFALWQLYTTASAEAAATTGLITPAIVTSGPLVAGQWNYVALAAPVPLTAGVPYVAATGWNVVNGFPISQGQFGPGQAYADGITNGPLVAYSDAGGGNSVPGGWAAQGLFDVVTADPTAAIPARGDQSSNFWVDVQVTDTPPDGTSFRLWPSLPVPPMMIFDSGLPFTIATEVRLSAPAAVNRIWFYSPPAVGQQPGATLLPQEAGIYDQATQALVAGTHLSPPAWSGAPGTGWVYCDYQGLTLAAGSYRVAVCSGPASTPWNSATRPYFTTGVAATGIAAGVLTAPGMDGMASIPAADPPGQGSYHSGDVMAWPDTYAAGDGGGPCYWIDLEVTPLAAAPGPGPGPGPVPLTFFP